MNKGLVSFFTIVLIVISLFQLSFTYFVNRHEDKQRELADEWVNARYAKPSAKYPSDNARAQLYEDTLAILRNNRYEELIEQTKNDIITYGLQGGISYQKAKESELNLGLDLQGGISVTLEIKFEDFLRSQSANPNDPLFEQALQKATSERYKTNENFIDVFYSEYKKINPSGSLLTVFDLNKFEKLPANPSDADIVSILKKMSQLAMENTFNILSKRIDQFGVAQPSINLDKAKGTISVELAGISNLDRARKYLQSSANLEFFEVYGAAEIANAIVSADKRMSDIISAQKERSGAKNTGASPSKDSAKSQLDLLLQQSASSSSLSDSAAEENSKNPILSLLVQSQNRNGAEIGYLLEKDKNKLLDYLKQTLYLFPKNIRFAVGLPIRSGDKNILALYALKPTINNKAQLEGKHITNASQDFDPLNPGRVIVDMEMNIEGARIWRDLTQKNIGKPIAVVLDDVVYTAPNVQSVIPNGRSQISGNFTIEEGQDLSKILKAGKLPVSASIVQEQVVGPTLGQETIYKGALSFLISFIVIFCLMLAYYNTGGWIANVALILNLLFTIGVLSALGATLTAAGIAGLILTIGMAVDANVIIFERIKEEVFAKQGMKAAIQRGFSRSLAPVLDSHVTTLLTAIILYYFGLGPVKGFATTQILGILLSLFCGILFSRLASEWLQKRKGEKIKFFTPLSNRFFKKANFKFIENRKIAYCISFVILIGGVAALFNGFHPGVEFSGGRSYTVQFTKKVHPDDARGALKQTLEEQPIIKTLGEGDKLNITTSYLINNNDAASDSAVLFRVYSGLKSTIGEDKSFDDFKASYLLASTKVLPTISEDLQSGSKWATFWSLVLIALYIFIRFRDWRYSLGTIIALVHDVLVVLIVFSFAKDIVPFSLEIDQHFIAAILTVIGFSMNDTIIVFDRVREQTKLMPTASRAEIINKAINNTLSRTVMTSLTVLLTVFILFLLGGDVTKGFSFALLIGILTGTYSSIFVAAPILIDFAKKEKSKKKS